MKHEACVFLIYCTTGCDVVVMTSYLAPLRHRAADSFGIDCLLGLVPATTATTTSASSMSTTDRLSLLSQQQQQHTTTFPLRPTAVVSDCMLRDNAKSWHLTASCCPHSAKSLKSCVGFSSPPSTASHPGLWNTHSPIVRPNYDYVAESLPTALVLSDNDTHPLDCCWSNAVKNRGKLHLTFDQVWHSQFCCQ